MLLTSRSDATTSEMYQSTQGSDASALASSDERRVASAWKQRIDDLLSVRQLKHDWDGLGAVAPHPELVDSAIDLTKRLEERGELPAPSRVAAGPSGTVLIEWQIGEAYLETEIEQPRHAAWMLECPGNAIEHWESSW